MFPVCRWGGEEFIVIAPNTPIEQMGLVAEKMRLAVLQALASQAPPVTISIGVAAATGHSLNLTALMADADSALYRAKDKGRNWVELSPAIAQDKSSKPEPCSIDLKPGLLPTP